MLLFLLADHAAPDAPNGADTAASGPAIPTGSEVSVAPVPRSEAADRFCPSMLAALPQTAAGEPRRRVASSGGEYAVAWGQSAIVLQCGVPRPSGFVATSQVFMVAQVEWFTPEAAAPTGPTATWTAVDRPVYVRVTVPASVSSDAVLADVATAIRRSMAAGKPRPAR